MAEASAGPSAAADIAGQSLLWSAAREASGRIERTLADVLGILARAGVRATLVEGSALSAELSSSDELVRRFASRASLSVASDDLARAGRTLVDAGWQATTAQGDMHLLRTAARHGRRLVFALIDQSSGDAAHGLHPAHPLAARLRNERLSRWRLRVAATFGRHESRVDELGRTVTETFELWLIEPERARLQVP